MTPEEIIAATRQHAADAGVALDLAEPTAAQEEAAAPYLQIIAEQQAIINHRAEQEHRDAVDTILFDIGARKPDDLGFPPWDPDTDFVIGDVVTHDERLWEAMADVERGAPPDDVYDLSAGTGGWKPYKG